MLVKFPNDETSQAFIGFSGTDIFAQYVLSSTINQNTGTPNCEKSKLIFRLDQKSFNKAGCNNEGNHICTMASIINMFIFV